MAADTASGQCRPIVNLRPHARPHGRGMARLRPVGELNRMTGRARRCRQVARLSGDRRLPIAVNGGRIDPGRRNVRTLCLTGPEVRDEIPQLLLTACRDGIARHRGAVEPRQGRAKEADLIASGFVRPRAGEIGRDVSEPTRVTEFPGQAAVASTRVAMTRGTSPDAIHLSASPRVAFQSSREDHWGGHRRTSPPRREPLDLSEQEAKIVLAQERE